MKKSTKIGSWTGLALTAAFAGCVVNVPSFNPSAGVQFSGQITTITYDPGVDPTGHTITIDWGDGPSGTDLGGTGGEDLAGVTLTGHGSDIDTTTGSIGSDNDTGTYPVFGTHTYALPGTYNVTVTVDDEDSNSGPILVDSDFYSPSPSPATALTATQTVAFNGTVLTITDTNTARLASELTATIDWGDSTSPTAGTITGGSGNFAISGNHTYPNTGDYTVTVTLQHAGGNAVPLTVDMTVSSPLSLSNFITSAAAGSPLGKVADLTDAIVTDLPSSLTAIAYWGDGTSETLTITGGSGSFILTSSHQFQLREGAIVDAEIDVNEISTPDVGAEIDGDIHITDGLLAPSARTIQARPNVPWSGVVASFYDSDFFSSLADYSSVSIDWGDGTAPTSGTLSRDGVNSFYDVSGSHTYATASATPLAVVVTVVDVGGSTVTIASRAFVSATQVRVSADNNITGAGVQATLDVGEFVVLDQNAIPANFAATIDWGDGSTASSGTITGGGGSFSVSGTHTYASAGSFTTVLTVTQTTAGGGSGSAHGTTTVNDSRLTVSSPGTIEEIAGVEFSWQFAFNDSAAGATASKYTVRVDWGDGTTASSATISGSATAGFTASAPHTYAAVGTDTATVTILDAASGDSLANFQVMVDVVAAASGNDGGATTSGHSSSSGCSMTAGAHPAGSGLAWLLLLLCGIWRLRRLRHS